MHKFSKTCLPFFYKHFPAKRESVGILIIFPVEIKLDAMLNLLDYKIGQNMNKNDLFISVFFLCMGLRIIYLVSGHPMLLFQHSSKPCCDYATCNYY